MTNGRGPRRPESKPGVPLRVVAFGGGHGLSASLRALKLLRSAMPLDLTAVVTVGDDGGSSGRLRRDRGGLPPGDLRQALTALADPGDEAVATRGGPVAVPLRRAWTRWLVMRWGTCCSPASWS